MNLKNDIITAISSNILVENVWGWSSGSKINGYIQTVSNAKFIDDKEKIKKLQFEVRCKMQNGMNIMLCYQRLNFFIIW